MSKLSGRGRVAGLPEWDRCAVMGVVNVTPDSFSDGGRWFDTTSAVKHGLALVGEGADLVDVGGESTRPGTTRVDEAEELRRVVPVVRGLASEGVTVSVDTMRASVAAQALAAGAALVNDVSGGLADPAMIPVVAEAGAPFVVMHWRGFLPGGHLKGGVEGGGPPGLGGGDPRGGAGPGGASCRAATSRACTRTSSPRSWTSCTRAWRPSWRAASPPTASSSTPASASPRRPNTTWPSSPTSTACTPWATPCWSPPPASVSSAASSPAPRAPRPPPGNATPQPPPSPPWPPTPAPGRSASTRYAPRRTRYGWRARWRGRGPPTARKRQAARRTRVPHAGHMTKRTGHARTPRHRDQQEREPGERPPHR